MSQHVTIIDYKAGNITSVRLAFEAVGAEVCVSSDPRKIRQSSRLVFPGVGAAGSAMDNLRHHELVDTIREVVNQDVPFLGICLGTQILLSYTEEDGGTPVLDILPGNVRLFRPNDTKIKVPHIGWNQLTLTDIGKSHPILSGIPDQSDFYFVHSYYPDPADPNAILGTTDYADVRFTAMLAKDNLIATQFHPEKSGKIGLKLLENFVHHKNLC